jgi:iron complex transport system substrate-binding protein
MQKKLLSLLLCGALSLAVFAGCTTAEPVQEETMTTPSTESETEDPYADEDIFGSYEETEPLDYEKPTVDRAGVEISVPDQVDRIVSLAPSTTQFLIELGLSDKIVGIDSNSIDYLEDLDPTIPNFDMMNPDNEAIAALEPDIVFTSGMSYVGGESPFQSLVDAGICVADIPTPATLEDLKLDLQFIGLCVNEPDVADGYVESFELLLGEVEEFAAEVPERKTVLFMMTIPSADYPTIYSFGDGTYMSDMLDEIGADNACAGLEGWVAITEEEAIAMNPDVILTNYIWTEDPAGDIMALDGWENVNAVKNGEVYVVTDNLCSRPNEHVAEAIIEWGSFVYPEQFAELAEAIL